METRQKLSRYIILSFLFCTCTFIQGQDIEMMVLANAGASQTTGRFSAESTLGEPIVGLIQNSFFSAQQGYHSPVSIDGNNGTSIDNQSLSGLIIYPNPFQDQLTIVGSLNAKQTIQIQMSDVTGKTVYLQRIRSPENKVILHELSHLPSGYYYLKVIHTNGNLIFPVIKGKN